MATLEFSPFDRQLLKLAAKSAVSAAKGAKKAAAKALLTQAESEAHAMEGYADEANLFLDNPEGIEDESGERVQLSFGHRTALRTGCLIRIAEIEDMAEEQQEVFCDSDSVEGTRTRAADFRRLETMLRTGEQQADLDLDEKKTTKGDAAEPTTPEPDEEDLFAHEGPFDAPPVTPMLALANPDAPVIPEAEFEVLEDDDEGDSDLVEDEHEDEFTARESDTREPVDDEPADDEQDPPPTDGDEATDLTL